MSKTKFGSLTQKEIADMHGVDVRTVRRWDEEGHPRNVDGTYNSQNSIGWRMQRETGSDLDLNAERARLAKEQADKNALDNAERRGELISVETIKQLWGGFYIAVRNGVLALPTKVAAELATMTDANRIRDRLTTELYQILSAIAAYRPGTGSADSGATDNAGRGDTESAARVNGKRVGGSKQKAKSGKQRGAGTVAH